jgi:pimeloyl-ACP methyl ester carboxylesterase
VAVDPALSDPRGVPSTSTSLTRPSDEDGARPPWPGREITSGGVTLYVRTTPGPDGVPAVYVHGLSGSATNWTDLAAMLAPRAAGTALDLPGFGHSRPLATDDYSTDAHADALMCFLAGQGRRVHLLGNSFGGALAISVAARRPELVATLTLVSPAMPDLRPDPRRITDPRLALAMVPVLGRRAKAQFAALTPEQRAHQMVQVCFGDPSSVPAERLAEFAAEIAVRNRLPWAREAVLRTGSDMIASWALGRLWSTIRRVRAPTLVVWGDRDRLVSPRLAARTAAAVPGSRLLMLPGIGHVAQIEAPGAVAAAVGDLWDTWEDPA